MALQAQVTCVNHPTSLSPIADTTVGHTQLIPIDISGYISFTLLLPAPIVPDHDQDVSEAIDGRVATVQCGFGALRSMNAPSV